MAQSWWKRLPNRLHHDQKLFPHRVQKLKKE
jgi:hypothetical protein